MCARACVCVCMCVCFMEEGRGGAPHMHGHKESYKDLNLKMLTSEWDSNPRPHEYLTDALPTELSGDLMSRASDFCVYVCGWVGELNNA